MLHALSCLSKAQAKGTQATMEAMTHLLNYAATNPEATVRFHASDMQLHIHSDASHLSKPRSRSRVGGYYFLDGKDDPNPKAPPPPLNSPVHIVCKKLAVVTASAAESKTGGLFYNRQEGAMIRNILEDMGYPQVQPTPIQTDNTTAEGIANDSVKTKRTKAMDICSYWIRDRVDQGQFHVHWKRGATNHADYWTKHHPPSHHVKMRPTYLHVAQQAVGTQPCKGVLKTDPGLTSPVCELYPGQARPARSSTVAPKSQ